MDTRRDDAEADAIASWQRYDDSPPEDLVRTVCGAFAVVAAADGEVSSAEVDRFLGVLRNRRADFGKLDFEVAERTFRELTDELLQDPVGGRRRVLADIARVKGSAVHRGLVRSAAYIAMIADARIERSEAVVLARIYEALGEPPEAV